MDLRMAVADRDVDRQSLRELAVAEGVADDPDAIGEAGIRTALREEFDLPDELQDDAADRVLSAALDDVAAGDVAAADERLADEFGTVCEREDPTEQATDADHPAACHLHDETVANKGWEWASVD
jgi:peptide/nickel transport system ATP-binding protein